MLNIALACKHVDHMVIESRK